MKLAAITKNNETEYPVEKLPEIAINVVQSTIEMYKKTGYHFPWVGYLAFEGQECVGTCAFKEAPKDGKVEIAYFTFPDFEGKGIATNMVKELVRIVKEEKQEINIIAQTLPESNSSTRVLEKNGFIKIAEKEHPEDGTVWEWEFKEIK